MDRYADRSHAGWVLAKELDEFAGRADVVVLGLPRGGVVVAAEVARALGAPLDAFVVRKLGVPGHSELAMGAVATGGVRVLNEDVLRWHDITEAELDAVARNEEAELARREAAYRGSRPLPDLAGRIVLLVDDGLATGASMRAAVEAVRALEPSRIVVAVPVAPPESVELLRNDGAEVICPLTPAYFGGVGRFYADFEQVTDAEVGRTLAAAHAERTP